MFNPKRLSLARRRRKYTKKSLAEELQLDQKTVIRYENGEVTPPVESLRMLAKALNFPEAFFFGTDLDEPRSESASFRSLSTMPSRDRDAALAAGALAFLLNDWVEERFGLPKHDLLECKEDTDPEGGARSLRQHWGIGERPIGNMVHMLEAKGVRVFSLVEDTRSIDAFSMWRRETPFVFLNTIKTAERSRFDAAHELGHLILHKHGGPQGRESEEQANQFASAFLMPEADIRARLPRIHSLNQLCEAKKLWGVSLAALNYRLHKLKITTDWQYRTFCIQIAQRFKKVEPYARVKEKSVVWEKIFKMLRSERITKNEIAFSLDLPIFEIENLVFQLTNMQSIDGSGFGSSKAHAKLELISGRN